MSPAENSGPSDMETINLAELYDVAPMDWAEVLARLEGGFDQAPEGAAGPGLGPGRHTCWLNSLNADGSPHANAVGALWADERFWFVTGRSTRRGRNLARDPRCLLALSLHEFDLVVEGRAVPVLDPERLEKLARLWVGEGWPCEVDGTALTAPYSAQSAGPAPWHVFGLEPESAHAVQTVEPHGATRWRF